MGVIVEDDVDSTYSSHSARVILTSLNEDKHGSMLFPSPPDPLSQLWTEQESYIGLSAQETMAAVMLHNKRPSLELTSQNCDESKQHADDPRLLVHGALCELIEGMWATDPRDRPTAMVGDACMRGWVGAWMAHMAEWCAVI